MYIWHLGTYWMYVGRLRSNGRYIGSVEQWLKEAFLTEKVAGNFPAVR